MRLLLLFTFCLTGFSLFAQNITSRLESHISFDDCNASDDSGNGVSGAFIGDTTCVCGVSDGAVRFDGVDDAIWIANPVLNDVFKTGDFTVSFYIKPAAPLPGQPNSSQMVLNKQPDCSVKNAFWVRYAPGTQFLSSTISESDSLLVNVSAKLDPDPCWQFIVLTRNSNVYTLYVNGVKRDEHTTTARVNLSSNSVFKIGEPVCPLDKPFRGDFDELRIYSRALSIDDIFALNLRPDQILNNDTLVYLGNSFQVRTSESCAQQFVWTPTTGVSDSSKANPTIAPLTTTTYTLHFRLDGCEAQDQFTVNVIDPDTLDCSRIFIPNAFTPGGSPGHNDRFGISNPFAVDDFISFEVFDRWGGRVFNAETPFDTWDGTAQGQPLNPGVLLYRLRWKCNGVEKVRTGNLTLLR